MSVRDARIGDAPIRLFRISFTGEMGYEIQIPADYGLFSMGALRRAWRALRSRPLRHRSYACAARGEGLYHHRPGHRWHGDPRRSRHGLDRLQEERPISSASARSRAPTWSGTIESSWSGCSDERSEKRLLEEGAQIVADPNETVPMTMIGHVTSSYRSPELGRSVRARHAETRP